MRFLISCALLAVGCSSSVENAAPLPPIDDSCAGACPQSKIKHVVVIIQENHTFDDHFGRYCTAPAGLLPSCTEGPSCCEAAPATDAAGHTPITLDDDAQALHDPDHTAACETKEMNRGAMDRYATESCGSPQNVAVGDAKTMQPFWDFAKSGAIADRYFQPEIGQSSANDMYFARATHVFDDNAFGPKDARGVTCGFGSSAQAEYTDKTIGDLLADKAMPWSFYAEGYGAMRDALAAGHCAARDPLCPGNINFYPCIFDPSDVPFQYYPRWRDNADTMKDLGDFTGALEAGGLPAVSFIKGLGFHTEHGGIRTTITDGATFVKDLYDAVMHSRYRDSTLFLVTYDEGGGLWDHVKPPATNPIDNKPYGTRVPMIAAGPFARKNHVSHVTMEHSSIVKFLEWNFLGQTGQLGTRDTNVANLGSLIDPVAAGAAVPED
jgi:phospholipase C